MIKERKPNRLKGYDYSSDNLYFVTSCVHNRICCFGEIVPDNPASSVGTGRDPSLRNGENISVGTGRDPSLRNGENISVRTGRDPSVHPHPQKIILNEYGKIAEKQWYWLQEQYPYIILHAFVVMPNHIHGIIEINRNIVGTGRDPSLQRPKIKSLSELIGAYKTTVSKQIHLLERTDKSRCRDRSRPVPTSFAWQRSFHEHIIRDEKSFETISDYILNNPNNWEQDNFHIL